MRCQAHHAKDTKYSRSAFLGSSNAQSTYIQFYPTLWNSG